MDTGRRDRVERRVAAVLTADVAGYSRLMGVDEEGTLRRLNAHCGQLIDPKISEHRGRIVKTTGDGLLAEFPSVVNAVRCAAEIQRAMVDRNSEMNEEQRITFRVGIRLLMLRCCWKRLSQSPASAAQQKTINLAPDQEEAAMLAGGCFCGALRYEASGTPFHETDCHCSICRRTTGAPFVTWFSVRLTDFRMVKGQPSRFHSTEKGTRSFCPSCGTQLTFQHVDFGDEVDVTTSSLDNPEEMPLRDNTHTSSRIGWIVPDGWPDHRERRKEISD